MNDSKLSDTDNKLDKAFQTVKSKDIAKNLNDSEQQKTNKETHDIKRPKEKANSTAKMNKYQGRDEKVDPDIYYTVKQENEHLKMHQYKLNDEIKR